MYAFLSLAFLITVFIILLFLKPVVILFRFNTETDEMDMIFYWIKPFLKGRVVMENSMPVLSLFIFNMRILTRKIKKQGGRQNIQRLLKTLDFSDVYIRAYYGLLNPAATGVVFGMLGVVQSIVNSLTDDVEIEQYPEFMPFEEYLVINTGVKLNIGMTLINFLHLRFQHAKRKRSGKYGSVQFS